MKGKGSNQWLPGGHEFRIQTPAVLMITWITHQIMTTFGSVGKMAK